MPDRRRQRENGQPHGRSEYGRYARYALAQRRGFAVLALLVPADIARQLVAPEVLRRFIDSALAGQAAARLSVLAAVAVGLALVGQVVAVTSSWVAAKVAWASTNRLRGDLVAHCLRQNPAFYQRHSPGELVDRIDGDVTLLAGVMSGLLLEVVAQILLVLGIIGALFALDWRMGAVFTPFALAMLLLLRHLAGRAVGPLESHRRAGADLLAFIEERLAGTEDIAPNGARDYAVSGLWSHLRAHYGTARRAVRKAAEWPVAVQALSAVSFCAAMALGVWLHRTAGISIGTVFAGLSYATLLRVPLTSISVRLKDVQDAAVSVRRLNALLGEASPIRDGANDLEPGPKDIAIEHVWYSYADQPALRDVTVRLAAGECLGVIGRTGDGKSTLVRLLARQIDPDHGTMCIGGVDLRDLRVASLRSRITVVPQEVHILHASLRENLRFFDPTISDERLRDALQDAGLGDWLAGLPAGLDTVLGADGLGLSAGQEQLISLARALLTDADVVLLDEPSARLDPHTLQVQRAAIERLVRGRTAVIVAHRAETLRFVDRVLLLHEGKVARIGAPEEMLADFQRVDR